MTLKKALHSERHFRKGKAFRRMLMSYIAICFVCIAAFCVFIPAYVLQTITAEITKNSEEKLTIFSSNTDTYISGLYSVANNISLNPTLKPFSLSQNAISGLQAAKELKKYLAAIDYCSEIGLYLRGDEQIYTSQGKVLKRNFLSITGQGMSNRFNRLTVEDFYDLIEKSTKPYALSSEILSDSYGNQSYCLYTLPLFIQSSDPYATLIFVLNKNAFQKIATGVFDDNHSITGVFDEYHRPFFLFGEFSGDTHNELAEFISAQTESETKICSLGGQEYLVTCRSEPSTQWMYVTAVSTKTCFAPVRRITYIAAIFCAVLSIGAILLTILFMRTNYMPIHRAQKLMQAQLDYGDGPDNLIGDEFAIIHSGISAMESRIHTLNARIQKGLVATREYTLYRLLNGNYPSLEDLLEECLNAGIAFNNGYFFCVQVDFLSSVDSAARESLIGLAEENMHESCDIYGTEGVMQHNILFILAVENSSKEARRTMARRLYSYLQENLPGGNIRMNVGCMVDEISHIRISYMSLLEFSSYRFLHFDEDIAFYEDIGKIKLDHNSGVDYDLQRLDGALRRYDKAECSVLVQKLFQGLRDSKNPPNWSRWKTFTFVSVLLNIIRDLNLSGQDEDETLLSNVSVITESNNIESCVFLLNNLINDLLERIEATCQPEESIPSQQIFNYLKEKCYDYSFSVSGMAEELETSKYFINRRVKEKTGQTVHQYVTQQRMIKARELLVNSNLTVAAIAKEVGFVSDSSFVKKFRITVGTTPQEYRNIRK